MYGVEWLWDNWKLIREDKAELYGMMMSVIPLAQTPWDKKHSQSQKRHSDRIRKAVENIAPWLHTGSRRSKLAHLRGKVKSGEVKVVLDAGDQADLGIYADAEIIRG